MRLSKDWRYVARYAWSMRLGILTAISSTFPLFVTTVPTVWFGALTMALAILTVFARVSNQPGMDRRHEDKPVEQDRRKE
jgi:hypothetical protein